MENCDWTTVPAGELVSVCAEHRLLKTPSGREFVSCRMVGGCAYTASLEEHPWFQNAFGYPCRLAVYDERGVFVCGVTNHTHHRGRTVVCTFVPPRDCTYYIEARGCAFRLYGPGEDMPESDWPDGPCVEETSAEAMDLGDLTGAWGADLPVYHFHGAAEATKLLQFTLAEPRCINFGLRFDGSSARIRLEDAEGRARCARTYTGAGNEWLSAVLPAGTHYLRAQMHSNVEQLFSLRYTVSAADNATMSGLYPVFPKACLDNATNGNARTTSGQVKNRSEGRPAYVSLGVVQDAGVADGLRRHWLVGGDEAGLFALDPDTGELFFTGIEADIEFGTTEFVLSVRTDDGERSEYRSVPVSVTNVADPGDDRAGAGVSLGRVALAGVSGVPSRYRLGDGNEAGLFELDETTGELFFKGFPEDFDNAPGGFELKVRVDADPH